MKNRQSTGLILSLFFGLLSIAVLLVLDAPLLPKNSDISVVSTPAASILNRSEFCEGCP